MRVQHQPIDAEEAIVLQVRGAFERRREDVHPMIEEADPQTPIGREGERGDVAIAQHPCCGCAAMTGVHEDAPCRNTALCVTA